MQEIVLYIKDTDGNYQQAELFGDENITVTSKIQDVRDIGAVFTDFSQSFSLPASKTNNKIFKHWYNYNIDDGFDTRIKVDALIEIDHLPFRRGKLALRNVKLKDNQASSYSVVFYGNTIKLKDLMRDDELKDLPYLDNYNHSYSAGDVYDGLVSGLNENSVSDSIIYPLITHTKRLYFDSTDHRASGAFIGHYNTNGGSGGEENTLNSSNAQFTSTINEVTPPVAVGDYVYNLTHDRHTLVTQVKSATKLTLKEDIFTDAATSTFYIYQNIQYSGNLYRDGVQSSRGLSYLDLKPAILCSEIIKSIENKYSIDFVGDFLTSDAFSNLYMWLHRNKGAINSGSTTEETKVIGNWTFSAGDDIFDIESGDTTENNGTNWIVDGEGGGQFPREVYIALLTITPSSDFEDTEYSILAIDSLSGNTLATKSGLKGTNTLSFVVGEDGPEARYEYNITWVITSQGTLSFTPSLRLTYDEEDSLSPDQVGTYVCSAQSTLSEIIVKNQVPKLKCIDFLTGLFKMFNLTAHYIDDVGDTNFGKIKIETLDDFYSDAVNNPSGGSYDISKHIDIENAEVEAAINYNRVEFKYQEPSTLLSINHQEKFNQVFGDESFELYGLDRAETYEIEVPFEHMKFERLLDLNVTLRASGVTDSDSSNKLIDSTQNFTVTVRVGDRVNNTTDNTTALITVIDSDTQLSLDTDIMDSAENYTISITDNTTEILYGYSADGEFKSELDANPAKGNYDQVLTKPLLFYGVNLSFSLGQKNINWINVDSSGSPAPNNIPNYFRPSNTNTTGTSTIFPDYTLNFDNEIDEFTLTDYNGQTNSLFRNFYANYINSLFDKKKRIFKFSAYLPTDILINYRLNDKFIIQDREFLINSIKTNLMTERSELELVNETDKTYYEIQLYYDFSNDSCTSGTLVTVYSNVPAVLFGSTTTGKIYSNKGLTVFAPNGKYSNGTNYDIWYADGFTPTTPSLRQQGWWYSEYDITVTYPLTCGSGG